MKTNFQLISFVIYQVLGLVRSTSSQWSVESVHSKNIISILHLLVSLARYFRAPVRLPENVVVNVIVVTKKDGMLNSRRVQEELTSTYDDLGVRCERDAFDTLFDHAPDKLQVMMRLTFNTRFRYYVLCCSGCQEVPGYVRKQTVEQDTLGSV